MWSLWQVAAAVGVCLITGRLARPPRAGTLIDASATAGALFVITWPITLEPAWTAGGDSVLDRAVSVAGPAGDLLLITVAVLLAAGARRGIRRGTGLLALGLAAVAVADAWPAFVPGAAVVSRLGWSAAVAALALCGWLAGRRPITLTVTGQARRWQSILPYLPFGVAAFTSALKIGQGRGIDVVQAFVLLAIVVLILCRQWLMLAGNARLTEQLRHQAQHDPLTGLANRTLFAEQLETALSTGTPTVLFLDLDDFTPIGEVPLPAAHELAAS